MVWNDTCIGLVSQVNLILSEIGTRQTYHRIEGWTDSRPGTWCI